jgi:hypothetical protein
MFKVLPKVDPSGTQKAGVPGQEKVCAADFFF